MMKTIMVMMMMMMMMTLDANDHDHNLMIMMIDVQHHDDDDEETHDHDHDEGDGACVGCEGGGFSARSFICCRISLDSPHPTLLPPAAADTPTSQ